MPFVSYAQNQEDVLLQRVFHDIENGFFVDVGAHHPSIDSVSRAFYDRGWRGINIDPLQQWIDLHDVERSEDTNLCLFVSNQTGTKTFYELGDAGGLSTEDQAKAQELSQQLQTSITRHTVPCQTLKRILESHSAEQIHFLKVDVEGAELAVLQGADFSKFRPWVIVVEATLPNCQVENHEPWERILTSNDYRHVYSDGLNRFYLAEEKSDLAEHFSYAINIHDEAIPFRLHYLHWRMVKYLQDAQAAELECLLNPTSSAAMLSNMDKVAEWLESRFSAELGNSGPDECSSEETARPKVA